MKTKLTAPAVLPPLGGAAHTQCSAEPEQQALAQAQQAAADAKKAADQPLP